MLTTLAAIWLVGCGSEDPELVAIRDALGRYDEAKRDLEAGRAEVALAGFEAALVGRADDPVLGAWRATSLARLGRLDEAITAMDEVLRRHPDFQAARWNRAAWAARAGRIEEAAADAKKLVGDDRMRARSLRQDPDFAPHLGHPAFGFLPTASLGVVTRGPEGPVFLGSEFTLELAVTGVEAGPVQVEIPPFEAPWRLVRVTEERTFSTEGPMARLAWTFRAEGPGEGATPGGRVRSGAWETEFAGWRAVTMAPEGRQARSGAVTFPSPFALRGDLPIPAVVRRGPDVLVVGEPGDLVTVRPVPAEAPTRFDALGAEPWVVWRVEGAPAEVEVEIWRGGTVLRGGPPDGEPSR